MSCDNQEMTYADTIERLRTAEPELADQLAPIHTLEKLLDWFRSNGLALNQLDLITQDEYSHDLLIPLDGSRWLSFAVT